MTEPTDTPPTVAVNRPPVFAKFYHASGLQVSVPLAVGLDPVEVYRDMDNWLAAGWKPEPPGFEPGEQKEEIAYVVRKFMSNDRGDSNRLDLYTESLKWSVLTVYLDSDADIDEFQKASGMRIQDVPIYEGSDKIERGKNPRLDQKYVVRLPRAIVAVSKPNPRYNAEEAAKATQNNPYLKPKKVFVRWGGSTATPAANGPQAQSQGPQTAIDAGAVTRAMDFLKTDPPLDIFNEKYAGVVGMRPCATRERLAEVMAGHAKYRGWFMDEDAALYRDSLPPLPAVAYADGDEIPF